MGDLVTRKQLATIWGVSQSRISALIRAGKLTFDENGQIDRDVAEQVRASFNPNMVQTQQVAKELGGQAAGRQATNHPLVQAKTMEAVYRAKTSELVFKKEIGELVEAKVVTNEAFELGRFIQQRLIAIVPRLSPELATLAALPPNEVEKAIRATLMREMRALITDLVAGLDQVQSQIKTTKQGNS